jgi:hypothetical protein
MTLRDSAVTIQTAAAGVNPIAPDATLTINNNTALPLAAAGTALHVISGDNQAAYITIDGFGAAGLPLLQSRFAGGTLAAKTAVASGTLLFVFGPSGWDGSAYNGQGGILFAAAENFDATHHGNSIQFKTVPLAGTASAEVLRVQPSGGLSVGSANVGTDPGNNIVLANGLQSVATTVGALGTCNTAAKGTRKFVTDGSAGMTTFHTTAAGGGSTNIAVTCDGTNWYSD